jgi:SAM-dependent methyltransferase
VNQTAEQKMANNALRQTGDSETGYFGHVRREIGALLPMEANDILEVGCASGLTLKWLKSRYPQARTTGVDGFVANLPLIQANADVGLIADLDRPLPSLGMFDLILALDVLEHLRDAEQVLATLVSQHLKPGGSVIVSLPAVSHYSVSLPLLLARKFQYAEAGILDRTHLRLYVEDSSVGLMNKAGLNVVDGLLGGLSGRRVRIANSMTGGMLKHWLTKQYIMRGVVAAGGQPPVRWRVAQYDR